MFSSTVLISAAFIVVCSAQGADPKIRLVGGLNANEGRVELSINGTWRSVCTKNWGLNEAKVACRMLNKEPPVIVPTANSFGQGAHLLAVEKLGCSGTEDNLFKCPRDSISTTSVFCFFHPKHVGIVCGKQPIRIRLEGGLGSNEGRVEIYHGGIWGTVCDAGWDLNDASVVCRMLGLPAPTAAPRGAKYGNGKGTVILSSVQCKGTENSLESCTFRGWGGNLQCDHSRDAGVVCGHLPQVFVNLVGGDSVNEGRVELVVSGTSGGICDSNWNENSAKVTCRMLGFKDPFYVIPFTYGVVGSRVRPLLGSVICNGTERSLLQCNYNKAGQCHFFAGLVCSRGEVGVRLSGGNAPNEGRVEVLIDGTWGSICGYRWNMRSAEVVCRMLGMESPSSATSAKINVSSKRWLIGQVCRGDERSLTECSHSKGLKRFCTRYWSDAVVRCGTLVQVRLVGGCSASEGRVEVYYNGEWGTVCDDFWNLDNAKVVCRMLGLQPATSAPGLAAFGTGSGKILLDDVDCTGSENTLSECKHRGWGKSNCRHEEDAGAVCGVVPATPCLKMIAVRLVKAGLTTSNEGRVEIKINEVWGTVCDDDWDIKDAAVVCRMLGFSRATAAYRRAKFGRGRGKIWLANLLCEGGERSLLECLHRGLGRHMCGHREDAGVTCEGKRT